MLLVLAFCCASLSKVRNGLEVIVKLQLPDDTRPKDVAAEFFPQRVSVAVKGSPVLSGTPAIDLDWEECYWDINREEEIQDDPQAGHVWAFCTCAQHVL